MVNKRTLLFITLILMLSAAFLGCAKKPSADDKVLVRMGNGSITLKEVQERIARLPEYYRNIVEGGKKRFVEELIAEKLFYEEAVRKGVNQDKEVLDVINEAKKKIIITKFIKNEVGDKVAVSEDEMRRFYDDHKGEFKSPELWRASHILVTSEKDARDILDELNKGASFEELAKARSIDATASRGGDVGYFRKGQLIPDFEKASLALNVGQTSDVVHTQFGYHIIKLTDKKDSQAESYEKVKHTIADVLKRKKTRELFDDLISRLKVKYKVQIDEEVAKALEPATPQKEGEKK